MNSLANNRAVTLKEASRACDLVQLKGEDLRYYVDLSDVRDRFVLAGVNQAIENLEPGEFDTILFTGHRGSGKSTELRKIQSYWASQGYQVIYMDAEDEIDIVDAQFTDLYLAIVKRVEEELRELKLKFDPQLLKAFENWFKQITKEIEDKVDRWWEAGGGSELSPEIPFVGKLVLKLLYGIKGSATEKKIVRETMDRNASELMRYMNLLLNDASQKLRNKFPHLYGLLIIFDALDRVEFAVGKHLFQDFGTQLKIQCPIIYTVPISIIYSRNLAANFGSSHIMPMVNIYDYKPNQCYLEHNENGLNAMASLIKHRVKIETVFESDEPLLKLAKASGGHVRQLMQLMRTACMIARAKSHLHITVEDVADSIQREQQTLENEITAETYYQSLAEVCLYKKLPRNQDIPDMLYRNFILEYGDNKRWYYVNPLLMQTDDFQKALQTAKEQQTIN